MGFKFKTKYDPYVEAYQITDDDGEMTTAKPQWLFDLIISGELVLINGENRNTFTLRIKNTKPQLGYLGQWIVKIKNKFHICPDGLFNECYEQLEDNYEPARDKPSDQSSSK